MVVLVTWGSLQAAEIQTYYGGFTELKRQRSEFGEAKAAPFKKRLYFSHQITLVPRSQINWLWVYFSTFYFSSLYLFISHYILICHLNFYLSTESYGKIVFVSQPCSILRLLRFHTIFSVSLSISRKNLLGFCLELCRIYRSLL